MKKHLLFLSLLAFVLVSCNFHEVDPTRFYRSAQLKGEEFQKAIDELGVKAVINLRGASPGSSWYDEEKEVTSRNGVLQIDIAMSAKRLPHRKDLIKLLDALRDAPRPILIHCQAGADRTGEASALYQLIYMGKSKEEALQMLDSKYLHLASRYPAKTYFIREVWQGEEWARREYDPCSGKYKYYDTNQAECQGGESNQALTEDDDT